MRPVPRGVLVACVLLAAGCARASDGGTASSSAATTAPAVAASGTPFASAWCHAIPLEHTFCGTLTIAAPKTTLRLAVADTEARREHGLMGVAKVPPGEGMMFAFPDGDVGHEFWMKDTITPLDMIFVRADGTVTFIAPNVAASKPGAPDTRVQRRRGVGRYVIELGAGKAAQAGIAEGTHLVIPDIPSQ